MAYKMKGSEFFGKGNSSPLKISDEAVVAAQDKLDHTELDFREPGWAKAARGISEGAHGALSSFSEAEASGAEGTEGTEDEAQKKSVQDIVGAMDKGTN